MFSLAAGAPHDPGGVLVAYFYLQPVTDHRVARHHLPRPQVAQHLPGSGVGSVPHLQLDGGREVVVDAVVAHRLLHPLGVPVEAGQRPQEQHAAGAVADPAGEAAQRDQQELAQHVQRPHRAEGLDHGHGAAQLAHLVEDLGQVVLGQGLGRQQLEVGREPHPREEELHLLEQQELRLVDRLLQQQALVLGVAAALLPLLGLAQQLVQCGARAPLLRLLPAALALALAPALARLGAGRLGQEDVLGQVSLQLSLRGKSLQADRADVARLVAQVEAEVVAEVREGVGRQERQHYALRLLQRRVEVLRVAQQLRPLRGIRPDQAGQGQEEVRGELVEADPLDRRDQRGVHDLLELVDGAGGQAEHVQGDLELLRVQQERLVPALQQREDRLQQRHVHVHELLAQDRPDRRLGHHRLLLPLLRLLLLFLGLLGLGSRGLWGEEGEERRLLRLHLGGLLGGDLGRGGRTRELEGLEEEAEETLLAVGRHGGEVVRLLHELLLAPPSLQGRLLLLEFLLEGRELLPLSLALLAIGLGFLLLDLGQEAAEGLAAEELDLALVALVVQQLLPGHEGLVLVVLVEGEVRSDHDLLRLVCGRLLALLLPVPMPLPVGGGPGQGVEVLDEDAGDGLEEFLAGRLLEVLGHGGHVVAHVLLEVGPLLQHPLVLRGLGRLRRLLLVVVRGDPPPHPPHRPVAVLHVVHDVVHQQPLQRGRRGHGEQGVLALVREDPQVPVVVQLRLVRRHLAVVRGGRAGLQRRAEGKDRRLVRRERPFLGLRAVLVLAVGMVVGLEAGDGQDGVAELDLVLERGLPGLHLPQLLLVVGRGEGSHHLGHLAALPYHEEVVAVENGGDGRLLRPQMSGQEGLAGQPGGVLEVVARQVQHQELVVLQDRVGQVDEVVVPQVVPPQDQADQRGILLQAVAERSQAGEVAAGEHVDVAHLEVLDGVVEEQHLPQALRPQRADRRIVGDVQRDQLRIPLQSQQQGVDAVEVEFVVHQREVQQRAVVDEHVAHRLHAVVAQEVAVEVEVLDALVVPQEGEAQLLDRVVAQLVRAELQHLDGLGLGQRPRQTATAVVAEAIAVELEGLETHQLEQAVGEGLDAVVGDLVEGEIQVDDERVPLDVDGQGPAAVVVETEVAQVDRLELVDHRLAVHALHVIDRARRQLAVGGAGGRGDGLARVLLARRLRGIGDPHAQATAV